MFEEEFRALWDEEVYSEYGSLLNRLVRDLRDKDFSYDQINSVLIAVTNNPYFISK